MAEITESPAAAAAAGAREPMNKEQNRRLAQLAYDPALPITRDYQHSGSFVSQELPVVQAWRDLAPFLTLPETCHVSFYCEIADVPDRVNNVTAELDPAVNRGYVRCQLGMYDSIYVAGARWQVRSAAVLPGLRQPVVR